MNSYSKLIQAIYHMMWARSPRVLALRIVSRPLLPGLLRTIRYQRQHVYLLCQNAILFLVKPKYKHIGHHPSQRKCKAVAIVEQTPSELDLKIARHDGNWPISARYSDDVTGAVGNSRRHPRRLKHVFRWNGIVYTELLVNSTHFYLDIIKSIMW